MQALNKDLKRHKGIRGIAAAFFLVQLIAPPSAFSNTPAATWTEPTSQPTTSAGETSTTSSQPTYECANAGAAKLDGQCYSGDGTLECGPDQGIPMGGSCYQNEKPLDCGTEGTRLSDGQCYSGQKEFDCSDSSWQKNSSGSCEVCESGTPGASNSDCYNLQEDPELKVYSCPSGTKGTPPTCFEQMDDPICTRSDCKMDVMVPAELSGCSSDAFGSWEDGCQVKVSFPLTDKGMPMLCNGELGSDTNCYSLKTPPTLCNGTPGPDGLCYATKSEPKNCTGAMASNDVCYAEVQPPMETWNWYENPLQPANQPPQISAAGGAAEANAFVNPGDTVSLQFYKNDPEGHATEFELYGLVPEGVSLESKTGLLTWTPNAGQAGMHTFQIFVRETNTSEKLISGFLYINLTVNPDIPDTEMPENEPPLMAPPFFPTQPDPASEGNHHFGINQPMEIIFAASDTNGNPFEYLVDGTLPEGAILNATTGVFSWTPGKDQTGLHTFDVYVKETNTSEKLKSNIVNVSFYVDNAQPMIMADVPTQITSADQAASFEVLQEVRIQLTTTDPDGHATAFRLDSELPEGAQFDSETGLFTWHPTVQQTGFFSFKVSSIETDSKEHLASEPLDIPIRVRAPNAQLLTGTSRENIGNLFMKAFETELARHASFTEALKALVDLGTVRSLEEWYDVMGYARADFRSNIGYESPKVVLTGAESNKKLEVIVVVGPEMKAFYERDQNTGVSGFSSNVIPLDGGGAAEDTTVFLKIKAEIEAAMKKIFTGSDIHVQVLDEPSLAEISSALNSRKNEPVTVEINGAKMTVLPEPDADLLFIGQMHGSEDSVLLANGMVSAAEIASLFDAVSGHFDNIGAAFSSCNIGPELLTAVGETDPWKAAWNANRKQQVTVTEDTPLQASIFDLSPLNSEDARLLSYDVTKMPEHGTFGMDEEGRYYYTPEPDYFGQDSFTVNISLYDRTVEIVVELNIQNVDDAPIAVNDEFEVDFGETTLDVLANDLDGENQATNIDPLKIVNFDPPPQQGTIRIDESGQFLIYKPNENLNGESEFLTYRIEDGKDGFAEASLTIGLPSRAVEDDVEVAENVSLQFWPLQNDINMTGGVITGVSQPSNGVVKIENDALWYEPNENYHGSDEFTYTVRDLKGRERTAVVRVKVASVNAPPVIEDIADFSVRMGDERLIDLSDYVSDVDHAHNKLTATLGDHWYGFGVTINYANPPAQKVEYAFEGGKLVYEPGMPPFVFRLITKPYRWSEETKTRQTILVDIPILVSDPENATAEKMIRISLEPLIAEGIIQSAIATPESTTTAQVKGSLTHVNVSPSVLKHYLTYKIAGEPDDTQKSLLIPDPASGAFDLKLYNLEEGKTYEIFTEIYLNSNRIDRSDIAIYQVPVNQPPVISELPASKPLKVSTVNEESQISLPFRVTDPEEDEVSVSVTSVSKTLDGAPAEIQSDVPAYEIVDGPEPGTYTFRWTAPLSAGTYVFTIEAVDANGKRVSYELTIDVLAPKLFYE